MTLLTFVTAVAPYHLDLVPRVTETVKRQTVRCEHVLVIDHEQRGAGWARNEGLKAVVTSFVAFLDADDWLDPTFAEKCLRAYDAKHYIYTDWITETVQHAPDDCAFVNGSFHVITTLLPTELVREVGGFDERLPGAEDSDLYLKIMTRGVCGKRLPEALFHYGAEGQRGQNFRRSTFHDLVLKSFAEKYGEMPKMVCCSDEPDTGMPELGQGQPGDVLARMLIPGARTHLGRATRRLYTKNANSMELWMNPRDIDSQPEKYARVVTMPPALDENEIARFRRTALNALDAREAPLVPSEPAPTQPNVKGVLGLYQKVAQAGK